MSQPLASLNLTIAADGTAQGEMSPVIYGTEWKITRYTTQSTSTLQTRLFMWLNFRDGFPVDTTYLGNGAASELPNPITLGPSDKLVWRWEGGTPGAAVTGVAYGEAKRK